MRELHCAHVLAAAEAPAAGGRTIRIDGESITAVETRAGAPSERLLAMPVLVNAHDHARTIRSSSIGAAGKPLEIKLAKDQEKVFVGFNDEKGRYQDNHLGKGRRHELDPLWVRIEVVRTVVD